MHRVTQKNFRLAISRGGVSPRAGTAQTGQGSGMSNDRLLEAFRLKRVGGADVRGLIVGADLPAISPSLG